MLTDDIGVVAIGRNEGDRLVRCLSSVRQQVRNIIYVDSGSTDGSISAAREIGASVVKLDTNQPFTAARARNEGLKALKASFSRVRFVQFIDGDCALADGWIETAYRFLERQADVAIVCGRRRELFPNRSIYNQLCDIEWNTPVGEAKSCGGDSFIRVDAFTTTGGFDAKLIAGEEPELCVRLRERRWKIWRIDAEMTSHDAAITKMRQFWTRSVRAGYAYAQVSFLHRENPYRIWSRETRRALLWGAFVPIVICAGIMLYPLAAAGFLIYPIQICRIAIVRGSKSAVSWQYAFLITVAKFAECQGVLKFYWHRLVAKQNIELIEYK